MEQTATTPSVSSPKIQFREPYGVDGRRLSVADATNEVFIDDDPSEDWTRTTAEKDSWAHRERRRSSIWQKIDSYPSSKPAEPSSPDRRRGSILSLFKHGKDKKGRDVLHSGDTDEWSTEVAEQRKVQEEEEEEAKQDRGVRRGSILSMWTWGKDKEGRDVIHSGIDESD